MKKLVNLKDGADVLVPQVLGGIDVNNVLATFKNNQSPYPKTYLATEDCIAYINANTYENTERVKIDGVLPYLELGGSGNSGFNVFQLPLKKGQTLQIYEYYVYVKIFGLKY